MGRIFNNFTDAEPCVRDELERENVSSLFDRYEWFERTHAECPPLNQPIIAHAHDDGMDAWLFLAANDKGYAQALSSWYTLAYRPVFTAGLSGSQKIELLSVIAKQLRGQLSNISLSPMHLADSDITAAAFRKAGWIAVAQETDCNWTVNVAGQSFAKYWAARPGRLRKTIKSKSAKAKMDVEISTQFNVRAWTDYANIYAESWKPEEGALSFLRGMAQTEGNAGTLRLGIGHIGGTAVAAQLWTYENGRAIAHKVAHRESAAEFSPGSLLSAAMFEYVIDTDHAECIDFGTGDSGYKSSWMEDCAPLYTLSLFNPARMTGLLRAAKLSTGMILNAKR